MKAIQGLILSLACAMVVSLGVTASPAVADEGRPTVQTATPAALAATACGVETKCPGGITPGTQQDLASSYCGGPPWSPRFCINFSRSEQVYIIGAGLTAAAIYVCRFGPAVCVVAGTIAFVAIQYLNNRGGLCPKSNPILEVEYAPHPGGYAKCSDG